PDALGAATQAGGESGGTAGGSSPAVGVGDGGSLAAAHGGAGAVPYGEGVDGRATGRASRCSEARVGPAARDVHASRLRRSVARGYAGARPAVAFATARSRPSSPERSSSSVGHAKPRRKNRESWSNHQPGPT